VALSSPQYYYHVSMTSHIKPNVCDSYENYRKRKKKTIPECKSIIYIREGPI